jgi:N-acetylneuraminic acid mutarotase
MNVPRAGHIAALLVNGKTLVAGGYNGEYLSSSEEYDPANDAWTRRKDMSVARVRAAATVLLDGRVLVAGGTFNGNVLTSIPNCTMRQLANGQVQQT